MWMLLFVRKDVWIRVSRYERHQIASVMLLILARLPQAERNGSTSIDNSVGYVLELFRVRIIVRIVLIVLLDVGGSIDNTVGCWDPVGSLRASPWQNYICLFAVWYLRVREIAWRQEPYDGQNKRLWSLPLLRSFEMKESIHWMSHHRTSWLLGCEYKYSIGVRALRVMQEEMMISLLFPNHSGSNLFGRLLDFHILAISGDCAIKNSQCPRHRAPARSAAVQLPHCGVALAVCSVWCCDLQEHACMSYVRNVVSTAWDLLYYGNAAPLVTNYCK